MINSDFCASFTFAPVFAWLPRVDALRCPRLSPELWVAALFPRKEQYCPRRPVNCLITSLMRMERDVTVGTLSDAPVTSEPKTRTIWVNEDSWTHSSDEQELLLTHRLLIYFAEGREQLLLVWNHPYMDILKNTRSSSFVVTHFQWKIYFNVGHFTHLSCIRARNADNLRKHFSVQQEETESDMWSWWKVASASVCCLFLWLMHFALISYIYVKFFFLVVKSETYSIGGFSTAKPSEYISVVLLSHCSGGFAAVGPKKQLGRKPDRSNAFCPVWHFHNATMVSASASAPVPSEASRGGDCCGLLQLPLPSEIDELIVGLLPVCLCPGWRRPGYGWESQLWHLPWGYYCSRPAGGPGGWWPWEKLWPTYCCHTPGDTAALSQHPALIGADKMSLCEAGKLPECAKRVWMAAVRKGQ